MTDLELEKLLKKELGEMIDNDHPVNVKVARVQSFVMNYREYLIGSSLDIPEEDFIRHMTKGL